MAFNSNNPPLSTIFNGDITVERGSDIAQFGNGDLNVYNKGNFYGTENSTNASNGTITVYGGIGIAKDTWIDQQLSVLGITSLKSTLIDTGSNGGVTVTGSDAVSISVGAASQFVSTNGNLTLKALNERLVLEGGKNDDNAVNITATNVDGGVNILSGITNGKIQLVSGAGGIYETASNGNIVLSATNGEGEFTVSSVAAGQNLRLGVIGQTDSQVLIESSGTNVTRDAIKINTTNTGGNISIFTNNGLGGGSISAKTGSGGFSLITNTGGSTVITTQAASSEIKNLTSNANDNLVLNLQNATDSSIILKSEGTSATRDAIALTTTNAAGNIHIFNTAGSTGYIHQNAGSGGYEVTTQAGGVLSQITNGAISTYTNTTTSDSQDLNISVTGATASRVNISSSGTGPDSIILQSTAAAGGILVTAQGAMEVRSNDTSAGIKIGTNNNVPINIGGGTSVTTIYGDLDVRGLTTTIESTVVTIEDNIIFVNNAPVSMSDGGMGIKRYQFANDTNAGEVVSDTADETGTAQGGSTSAITLSLSANGANDYYTGWWVKITGGTGASQVRRIKTYNGIDKIATIYTTVDQTGVLNNPTPVEGLDFTTPPDGTSTYSLYPCAYILAIWDESLDEFAIVCTPSSPGQGAANFSHYSNLHINDLQANNILATTVNGATADRTIFVTLTDNATTPVLMPDFLSTFGVFIVMVKPRTTTTRAYSIFLIGRVDESTKPGQVSRIISIKGTNGGQLDMSWNANSFPSLQYRPAPGVAGTTEYSLRLITI
jgi:hypothetical protein